MNELMLMFPCDESYRDSVAKINRVLWRDEEHEIKSRTLADIVVREGESIQECLLKKTQTILVAKGFDEFGKPLAGAIVVTDSEMIGLPQGKLTNSMNKEYVKENQGLSSDYSGKPITLAAPIRQSPEEVKAAIDNYIYAQ